MNLSPDKFVKAWQKAKSLDSLSKATGDSKPSLSVRAYLYRLRGIQLKRFPRGGHGLDIGSLSVSAKANKRRSHGK